MDPIVRVIRWRNSRHDRIIKDIYKKHREALSQEVAERERACSALETLYKEEILCLQSERDEWRRMYEQAMNKLHSIGADRGCNVQEKGENAMTAITLTVFPDAEKWLRENLEQYIATDRVAAVIPITEFQPDGRTTYEDLETGKKYRKDMKAHVRALQIMCEMVGRTLFVGGIKNPYDLTDPGNWDVEVADAYFQLVALGEVVYG